MKKLIAISLLAISLSTTVKAGDVPFPPAPPCQACKGASSSPVPPFVIQIVLSVLASR